jgi:hypothetical protein
MEVSHQRWLSLLRIMTTKQRLELQQRLSCGLVIFICTILCDTGHGGFSSTRLWNLLRTVTK